MECSPETWRALWLGPGALLHVWVAMCSIACPCVLPLVAQSVSLKKTAWGSTVLSSTSAESGVFYILLLCTSFRWKTIDTN